MAQRFEVLVGLGPGASKRERRGPQVRAPVDVPDILACLDISNRHTSMLRYLDLSMSLIVE